MSDVLADDTLTPAERAERGCYVGCIAGALSFAEYRAGLAAVGLVDVEITPTHAVADGLYSAIVRAVEAGRRAGRLARCRRCRTSPARRSQSSRPGAAAVGPAAADVAPSRVTNVSQRRRPASLNTR